jgi:hypothetical protein
LVYGRGRRIFRGPGAEGESPVKRLAAATAAAIGNANGIGKPLRTIDRDADAGESHGHHVA